jgi:hypothetical protein
MVESPDVCKKDRANGTACGKQQDGADQRHKQAVKVESSNTRPADGADGVESSHPSPAEGVEQPAADQSASDADDDVGHHSGAHSAHGPAGNEPSSQAENDPRQ